MTRPPFARAPLAQHVASAIRHLRRSAKAEADRLRLRDLMAEACRLRAARQCDGAAFDHAAQSYARARLATALKGLPA